jgi:hypothetical protein
MSSGYIYRVAATKLTNVYIVAIIRILMIENSGDMCCQGITFGYIC